MALSARARLDGDAEAVFAWHRTRGGELVQVEVRLRASKLDALAAKAVERDRKGLRRPASCARGGVEVRVTRKAK